MRIIKQIAAKLQITEQDAFHIYQRINDFGLIDWSEASFAEIYAAARDAASELNIICK